MSDKTDEAPRRRAVERAPFSHMLDVDRVPEQGLDVVISADPQERQALADFDKIPAVGRFEAEFHVARRGGKRFNVSGEMRALVTQICVVSLEPFETEIIEAVDVDFAPPKEAGPAPGSDQSTGAVADVLEAEEPPDPIIDGRIDLGALAGEFLVLGLDPHPRKPGATFAPAAAAETPEDPSSPFAVLKKIQKPN
jgi:Large ribosomal RNA subunit accumulation protein YceD